MIQKLIFPLIFVLFASNIYAQVVINEISYNPPETNTDSLESVSYTHLPLECDSMVSRY